jgi:cell division protein FtsB
MFACIHGHLKINGNTIQSVKDTVSKLSQTNEKLTKDVDSLEHRMSLLEAKLDRSDVLNKRLQNEILDLQTRSMNNNVIFTFDKNSSDYGCHELC